MSSALARFVVHAPGIASRVHLIDDSQPRIVGRVAPADLVIDHPSVSRRHAELRWAAGGCEIVDLDSKNGVRIDGERVPRASLSTHCWLSIGDVFCEFEPLSDGDLRRLRSHEQLRRHSSAAWQARIDVSHGIDELLDNVLSGMVAVAECRRGFVLLGDGVLPLHVAAYCGVDVGSVRPDGGGWSRSAVERAMRERRPVFLSQHADRVWLKGAPSVVGQGLRALGCVPLLHHGRLLGLIYVDTDEQAKQFTELDVELMQAFAERAATALALDEVETAIRSMEARAVALLAAPDGMPP